MATSSASADFTGTLLYDTGVDFLDNIGEITVMCWVNSDDTTDDFDAVVCKGAPAGEAWFLQNGTGNGFAFRVDTNLGNGFPGPESSVTSTGVWYNVSGTWNTSDTTTRINLDGVEVASKSRTGSIIANTGSTVKVGTDGFGNIYDGKICFVQGWDRQLSLAEITQAMYMPGTVPANLQVYSQFFTSNATEYDLSGNGRDFTRTSTGGTSNDGPPVFMLGGQ